MKKNDPKSLQLLVLQIYTSIQKMVYQFLLSLLIDEKDFFLPLQFENL